MMKGVDLGNKIKNWFDALNVDNNVLDYARAARDVAGNTNGVAKTNVEALDLMTSLYQLVNK